MPAVTDITIPLPGGRLIVQDAGPPDGLPVLVYNGSPGSRHLCPAALRLARGKGIRLIGVDPPGYGGSAAQPDRRIADSAADARAIADALGITRLAVWGISGGGPVALASAALLPDLIVAACVFAADRIPGVDAHFPADDDHGTIEANHASQAYDWLIAVAQGTSRPAGGRSPKST